MRSARAVDSELKRIARKVERGCRLDLQDGLYLYNACDLFSLAELATLVREQLHGRTAYYVLNRHINYTNRCILRCRFCGFRRSPVGSVPGAYTLEIGQIVAIARQACDAGATEVHIVGGLHPDLPFEYYDDMIRSVRQACPRIHIKAFTAVEVLHFTRMARPALTVGQVLERLRDAGLDSMPGGGAEIFDERVHDVAFAHKPGSEDWFAVHRTAHEMGINTNATMLYGHVESIEQRLQHLIRLREHQDESLRRGRGHFVCFVPLSFVPAGDWADLPGPTGLDDLKTFGLARLMLDNIPHLKAFWPILSVKVAQVALCWGADDFDGTVGWYDVAKGDPAAPDRALSIERIRALITEAGFQPQERNATYQPVQRCGSRWWLQGQSGY